MRIGTFIILSFVFSGVILTIGATYLSLQEDLGVMRELIINHLDGLAVTHTETIEVYLEESVEEFGIISHRTQLLKDIKNYNSNPSEELRKEIAFKLKDSKDAISELERISFIGLDGKVVASTNELFVGKDFSGEEFFLSGKIGDGLRFVEEDGVMKSFISGPLYFEGELLGVGTFVENLDELEMVVNDRAGLGETGEIVVAVQGEGKRIYLFDRLFEEDALDQFVESSESAEPIKQALLGNEIIFENSLDYRNESVFAVSKYIELGKIGVVVKIDVDEVLGNVKSRLYRTAIITFFAVIFFTIVIGFFISRIISRPIMKLRKEMDLISNGELDVQLSKSNLYEVQSLTDSLNKILVSLKLAILRTGASKGEFGLGEREKKVMGREMKAIRRESVATGRETQADIREKTAGERQTQADIREKIAGERQTKEDIREKAGTGRKGEDMGREAEAVERGTAAKGREAEAVERGTAAKGREAEAKGREEVLRRRDEENSEVPEKKSFFGKVKGMFSKSEPKEGMTRKESILKTLKEVHNGKEEKKVRVVPEEKFEENNLKKKSFDNVVKRVSGNTKSAITDVNKKEEVEGKEKSGTIIDLNKASDEVKKELGEGEGNVEHKKKSKKLKKKKKKEERYFLKE